MKTKLVLTAVVALTAALLPFSGSAAPAPTAEDQNRTTVGIRAATNGQPDKRPHYEYEILPKKVKQDAVAVYNYSLKPVTVRLLPRDAVSTPDGEFAAQESSATPTDVGAWIALSRTELKLEPRSMTIVPFQIGVPFNATPGDHAGSILVSLLAKQPKPGSGDVVVEHRVGLRVYLRVPGDLDPALSIQNLKSDFGGGLKSLGFGSNKVTYTIRNTGNVRLSTEQQVEQLRLFGLSSATKKPAGLKELLPGGFARIQQEFPRTWAVGNVTSKVTLTPAGLDPSVTDVPKTTEETSVFVFPWLLLLILVGIGLAIYGYVRHKRRPETPLASDADRGSDRSPDGDVNREPVLAAPAEGAHKHRLVRGVLATLAALTLVGLGTTIAPPAQAADEAPMWKANVLPKSGGSDDPIELQTSGGCPGPADSILGKVYGKGFPKEGINVIGNTTAGVTPNGPFPAPLAYSMKQFMFDQPKPVDLEGTYRFVVTCRTAKFPKSYGDYVAEIKFTSPTQWVASKPVTTKSGPNLQLDETGTPVQPSPGANGASPGAPSNGASPGAPAADDPALAGDGSPLLTESEDDSGPGALTYGLIIGGVAIGAATVLLLWRRSS